jgi:hypothetical protein
LFGLWTRHVIPSQFIRNDTKRLVLQGKSSSFRYDLFEGNVTLDNLMVVSPFNDSMYLIASDVRTATIVKLDRKMNAKRNLDLPGLPNFLLIKNVGQHATHDLYTLEYEVPFIQSALEEISGKRLKPLKVNAFATSIWQSFVEKHWQNCSEPSISSGSKDTKTTTESTIPFWRQPGTCWRKHYSCLTWYSFHGCCDCLQCEHLYPAWKICAKEVAILTAFRTFTQACKKSMTKNRATRDFYMNKMQTNVMPRVSLIYRVCK